MELPERTLPVWHIEEPQLGFAHGQTTDHPKDGLYLYGPQRAPQRIVTVNLGVVGTSKGLALFRAKLTQIEHMIEVPEPATPQKENRLHLSQFPGLTEAFGIRIDKEALVEKTLDETQIRDATSRLNHHEAVREVVDLYIDRVQHHEDNEEQNIDVWLFVVPEIVFESCRPQSKRTGITLKKGAFPKKQKKPADLPLLTGAMDMSSEEIFEDVPDFHRQIKARMLKIGKTSQLVRETTLSPESFKNAAGYPTRGVQDDSTLAWNLATGLYYKARPEPPWKLISAREGVCYMGLVFKKIPNHPQQHACCAAQMFLNEGDGLVFRGANGPWETKPREFHLPAREAEKLLAKVLETFKEKHGEPPKELFIHGRTKFEREEWDAFCRACPEETNLVYVRIRHSTGDTKLFRQGDYPVIRGTALVLDEKNAFLWSSGFLPRLDTYIGPETPNPLLISVLRSTGPTPKLESVLRDILGLTKINYNACNFNDGLPVTVRFADKVGDVLVQRSARGYEKQPFKFYV